MGFDSNDLWSVDPDAAGSYSAPKVKMDESSDERLRNAQNASVSPDNFKIAPGEGRVQNYLYDGQDGGSNDRAVLQDYIDKSSGVRVTPVFGEQGQETNMVEITICPSESDLSDGEVHFCDNQIVKWDDIDPETAKELEGGFSEQGYHRGKHADFVESGAEVQTDSPATEHADNSLNASLNTPTPM